jgi:hypothetical protein
MAMSTVQRVAVQLPQAHHNNCQNAYDLAREAVGWNGGLGGLAAELGVPQRHERATRHDELSAEPHAAPNQASTTDTEKAARHRTTGRWYGQE